MRAFKTFLEVLGYKEQDFDSYNVKINVCDESMDHYSISTINNITTIDASNERSVLYAIYDVVSGKGDVSFKSRLKQRGVHLDCGRKYFASSWIKNLIIEIFKNKLNTLQLHFSENEGFRLELPGYESLTSNEFITYNELKEIMSLSKTLKIHIIPSFDSPGHLKHLLKQRPEYLLNGIETGLDITNPDAKEYIKGIYIEVLKMFKDSKSIHIGGDEFIDFDNFDAYPQLEIYAKETFGPNATSIDGYIDYINEIGQLFLDANKEVHVWNDPFYRINQSPILKLNPEFIITYWTSWNRNMAPVQSFINAGHRILNYMDTFLYFVVGENAGYTYPTSKRIEHYFEPHIFPNRHAEATTITQQHLNPDDPRLEGAMVSIWCDKPEALTQEEILVKFLPILDAFANKCHKSIKSS